MRPVESVVRLNGGFRRRGGGVTSPGWPGSGSGATAGWSACCPIRSRAKFAERVSRSDRRLPLFETTVNEGPLQPNVGWLAGSIP